MLMTPDISLSVILGVFILVSQFGSVLLSKPQSYVETVSDPKEWKKILRTRTNVLVLYSTGRPKGDITNTFNDVSRELRGTATLCFIDCSGEGKKLCKKNRVEPESYVIKHYKDGDFHKDYDRRETVPSLVTFLRDPGGDLPWDEDPNGENILHINDIQSLSKLLKKEKSFMMMFYAPWCGFCKRLKPDYAAAAAELKDDKETYILAAMDVHKAENTQARLKYNITGFPTLIYFENGAPKYTYDGENNKAGLVSFMKNPGHTDKPKEESWTDVAGDVVHLKESTFHAYLKKHSSVLVMFYAPWCGHCKKMKPDFSMAATLLKEKEIEGTLAAVDVTQEKKVAEEFTVKGFPTLKYFKDGELAYDVSSLREKDKIVEFMIDPKEPPPPPPPEKPWMETDSSVFHLNEENFKAFLKKKKHVLVMFYAPWCGHCQKAKPEFTAAADKFSDDPRVEFAALDCTAFQQLCVQNEVRGYPTFRYFNYYKSSKLYNGGRTESDFISFMSDPDNPAIVSSSETHTEDEWGHLEGCEHLTHLTATTFDNFIKTRKVLTMFHAPWCGHCKAMKGEFCLAAKRIAEEGVDAHLATVDATLERHLASKYNVDGFPTLKLFTNGVVTADYSGDRTSTDLTDFIKKSFLNSNSKEEL